MIGWLSRLSKEQHGQSLLEFALIVPVLFVLVCGIIDLGRVLYTYLHLNMAVQEAVRLAGLGGTDVEIQTLLQHYVRTDPELVSITISPLPQYRESGDYVTVAVELPVRFVTPILSGLVPDPTLAADSTIRIE